MSDTENVTDSDKIKYLVSDTKGEFVIELPPTWKVTFSNVNPAVGGDGGYRDRSYCVRVWEKKDVLRAVFCNVIGIRDMAIPLARKVEKQTGSSTWSQDSVGNFEGTRKVEVEGGFVLESGDDDSPF
jgi:hypothetical protein